MNFLRRLLGIWVMFAGILGLVLSLAGLAGVWMVRPSLAAFIDSTIVTLDSSINTSKSVMQVTSKALGATVDSVDALSVMLGATAISVEDTQPALDQLNEFMSIKLPTTIEAATSSLKTAEQAAVVLDSSIKSLDTFRFMMSGVPLVSAFVEQPTQAYNPEKPLAESLGEVAVQLEDLPGMFTEMAASLDKADDNLVTIQTSLVTMSDSVSSISTSLSEYEAMLTQSESSMDNLRFILVNIQNNLDSIINGTAIALTIVFLWLLTAQVVILSQGWELFQGTAGRMEDSTPEVESKSE